MDLKGIAAIVTGGASGLGGATAELLAAQGAKVTIFDLAEESGRVHAKKIGGNFIKVNVADEVSVEEGLGEAEAANGIARVLVNCAGIVYGGKTVGRDGQAHALDQFRKVIDVNLVGTFNVLSKFAARLVKAELIGEERGVIINTASVAAFEGQVGQAAYAASKGGIVGLTLPIARDLAQSAIRVVGIAPGLVRTPMMASLPPEAQESLGKQVPFPNRLGKPEEYALMVQSIVINPLLNGTTIRLDGALRMAPR